MSKAHNSQRKHTVVLLMLAVGMFGFAFALVPLYAKFCELTGLNGKTSEQVAYSGPQTSVDDRVVTVQFLGIVGTGMPWEFRPMEHQLLVRPGTLYTTQFYVRNRASQPVTGQAIPSVSPGLAALHLHKTECFCFTQQQLAGGEEMEMPVTFFIDTDLPEGINTLSLSYTLYRVNPVQTAQVVSN
jgi:cytochrome c oxidase assembly protein subunit 11